MLPKSYGVDLRSVEIKDLPSKTYKLDIDNNRIIGFTDELDAIRQAIYLMLNVERYEHVIYSWDYGIELNDLYGKNINYIMSEVPRRISDAILQDRRILSVDSFHIEKNKNKLHVTFTAHTIYGDVDSSTEVLVHGV